MKLSQKGSASIVVALLVCVIALIGGIGYYVWQNHEDSQQSATTKTTSTGQSKQVSRLTLDATKLPAGWTVLSDRPYEKSAADKDNNCTAGVLQTADKTAKASEAQAFIKKLIAKELNTPNVDGDKPVLGTSTQLKLQTNQGPKNLAAYEVDYTLLDADQYINKIRAAFIVGDGYYLMATEGCTGTGIGTGPDQFTYTEADQALQAITIKTN